MSPRFEKGRTYRVGIMSLDGEFEQLLEVPSATNILGYWSKGQAFTNWVAKTEREGSDHKEVAGQAATRGTDVHKLVNDLALFGEFDPEGKPPQAEALQQFWTIHKPTPARWEYPTFHLDHRYAGTIDLRFSLTSQGTGLLDLKTVNRNDYLEKYDPYENHQAQLVAYAMAEASLGRPVDFLWVVRLGLEGKHHVFPIPEATWPKLFAAFLGCIAIRDVSYRESA